MSAVHSSFIKFAVAGSNDGCIVCGLNGCMNYQVGKRLAAARCHLAEMLHTKFLNTRQSPVDLDSKWKTHRNRRAGRRTWSSSAVEGQNQLSTEYRVSLYPVEKISGENCSKALREKNSVTSDLDGVDSLYFVRHHSGDE